MKLEGLDPCHPSLFCVLTVAEVRALCTLTPPAALLDALMSPLPPCARQIQGYRVRLHFDGYPECYDFWANADSWDLKPAGWCEKNGHKLLLPKGEYEAVRSSGVASKQAFSLRPFSRLQRRGVQLEHVCEELPGAARPKAPFQESQRRTSATPRRPSAAHLQVQSLVFATDRFSLSFDRSL